jgi:hypothetical protein
MSLRRSRTLRVVSAILCAYLGFFAILSVDVLVRVFVTRGRFEQATDAATLIALEFTRSVIIIATLAVALRLARAARRPAAQTFSLLIALLGIWYAKAFGYAAFPGYLQEWMAGRLLAAGAPRPLLVFLFGMPEWAIWLALAAGLIVSSSWPSAVLPDAITRSGASDRAGMMRSHALAGADVGAAFRITAARAVAHGWLRPRVVWSVLGLAGVAHSFGTGLALRIAAVALFAAGCAVAITNVRASFANAPERAQWRILWTTQAAITAAAAFLVTGLLSARPEATTGVVSFAVASLAPLAVLMAVASGALPRRVTDPRPAIRKTIAAAAAAVCGVVAYLLTQVALAPVDVPGAPLREIVGIGTGIALIALTRDRLRTLAQRLL